MPTQCVVVASRLPPSKSTSSPGGKDGATARARAAVVRVGLAHTKAIVRVVANEIIFTRTQGTLVASLQSWRQHHALQIQVIRDPVLSC